MRSERPLVYVAVDGDQGRLIVHGPLVLFRLLLAALRPPSTEVNEEEGVDGDAA